jgi:hypothetical protein
MQILIQKARRKLFKKKAECVIHMCLYKPVSGFYILFLIVSSFSLLKKNMYVSIAYTFDIIVYSPQILVFCEWLET